MRRAQALLLLVMIACVLLAQTVLARGRAAAGFEKLKSLVGEWTARSDNGRSVRLSYTLVSGDTALMESLEPENEPTMISVYHVDGEHLVMTHYCSAGNQPRMRAEVPPGEIKLLAFRFTNVTNLKMHSEGHMRHLALAFIDRDHITQTWAWREKGKEVPTIFNFERKK